MTIGFPRRLKPCVFWLCLAVVCPAALAPRRASAGHLFQNQSYWYLDIYRRFFVEETGPDGKLYLVSRRPNSRQERFPKQKPPGGFRVFVIGGSVARQYDSHPEWNDGWNLARVLGRLLPGRKVEVINCGMDAYDSYRESLVLGEILRYSPDLVILLSGHNEIIPQGGRPSLRTIAAVWIQGHLGSLRRSGSHGEPKNLSRQDIPGRLKSFESNLAGMVRDAGRWKVPIMICALPTQTLATLPSDLPLWMPSFFEAWAEWERGDFGAAERGFRRHLARVPDTAYAHFYLGRCLEKKGDLGGARKEYRARPYLYSAGIREVMERVGREPGAIFCDVTKAFERASPGGRDERLLYDPVHWFRYADPLVSVAIARSLAGSASRSSGAIASGSVDLAWLDGPGRKIGSGEPRREELKAAFLNRLAYAVWDSDGNAPRFLERNLLIFDSLRHEDPDALARFDGFRERLRAQVSGNPWVSTDARGFDRKWAWALAHVGEVHRRIARNRQALRLFEKALAIDPGLDIVRFHRALALRALGESGKAGTLLSSMEELELVFPEVRLYLERLGLRRALPAYIPEGYRAYEYRPWSPAHPGSDEAGLPEESRARLREALVRFIREEWPDGFRSLSGAIRASSLGEVKRYCQARINCAPWERARGYVRHILNGGLRAYAAGERAKAMGYFDKAARLDPDGLGSAFKKAAEASKSLQAFWDYLRRYELDKGEGVGAEPLKVSKGLQAFWDDPWNDEPGRGAYVEPLKEALARIREPIDEGLGAYAAGERAKAMGYFDEAARLDPDGLGAAFKKAAETSKGLQAFWDEVGHYGRDKGVDVGPLKRALARIRELNAEGIRAYGAGERAKAVERFNEALKLEPNDPSARLSLGAIASKEGRFSDALRSYGRVPRAGLNGDVLADLAGARALVLERMGREDEALRELEAALGDASLSKAKRGYLDENLRRLRARRPK